MDVWLSCPALPTLDEDRRPITRLLSSPRPTAYPFPSSFDSLRFLCDPSTNSIPSFVMAVVAGSSRLRSYSPDSYSHTHVLDGTATYEDEIVPALRKRTLSRDLHAVFVSTDK